jgi:CHRD domain
MTRASVLTAVLASLAIGCGSSATAPTPTPPPDPRFSAQLQTSNEVPPIGNAEQVASGSATLTFVTTKDAAGAVTGANVTVVATLTGFPAGSTITVAHIHTGASGVAGGVLVPLIPPAGSVTLTNGGGSFTQSQSIDGPTATSIINNPAGFYFNVHTALNPGGVMRGQLVRTN